MKNVYAAIAAIALVGCQKNSNTPVNAAAVNLAISAPTEAETFHSGDTVHIKADVSYSGQLHGCEVQIMDSAGNILFDEEQHVHSDKFVIDEKWVTTATIPMTVTLTVTAFIDHNGNDVKKNRVLHLEP